VFFTRNNAVSESVKEDDKTRTVRLKIYTAERSGRSNWGKVRELTFNSGDYSSSAPALHPNGELMIFSSTMPGGFGGADLYLSRLVEGEWSRPVNLGAAINTEGDEMFPFLHTDGTLYFSSDGHAGLGGLDVFYAEWKDERWDNVRNMGWTLNSRWDDFGLVWDEDRRRGFFASNRPGGAGGDDLYAMRHNWVRVRGQVLDAATGLPLPGSSLHILGGPGEKRLQADAEGLFSIDLPPRVAASLSAHSEGYTEGRAELTTPADGESELVRIALERDPVKVNLLAVDRQTRKPVPGVEFVWENGCSGASTRHPGNDEGRLSMPVSRYCTYRLTATVEGYADGELAVPASLLEGQSEVDLVVDLEFLHPGMVVELHNIYYDFDQDYVREDGEADLIALAEFMQRNPGVSIELESHTDARGTNTYNTQLSQRRAESARGYLVKLGVEPGRVTARGYGESALRNQCADGVNCSDEEHQMNRRTQFRITGLDRELQSSDKPFVPVNTGRRAR
jgi:outer membrane protein OmpA-like peptidoglycan-associated protein